MDDQPHAPLSVPPRTAPVRNPDFDERPRLPPHLNPGRLDQRAPEPPPRSGWRRAVGWLVVLLLAGGLVAWLLYRAQQPQAPAGRLQSSGATPVGTARVEKGDMPVVLSALGTVTPLAMVTVKTQIAGQLVEVGYKEGQLVNKGDFLAQIDPRPYQVALAQAEGQLAKDQAALKNAETDLGRYRTLVAQNSIARQTLDTQVATVAQMRGTVQADQAQVDAQKLNLTYCRIVAPVGGRVGLRLVDPGNYVQTNDATGIVVITQIQPISVIFTLPSDDLPTVMRRMQTGTSLAVTAFDRTGNTKLAGGTLDTLDNQIDTTTGMVKLRAVFDNADQALFPNLFVNVQLQLEMLHDTTVVPSAAVLRGAPGTFVYLVKPDDTVTVQPVTLGPTSNQRVAVTKGLEPGQMVVVDGTDRLRDGAKVRIAGRGQPPAAGAAPAADGAAPAAESTVPTPAESAPAAPASDRPRGQGRRRSGE
jgi:multidrug efflux system membrane fusion protein